MIYLIDGDDRNKAESIAKRYLGGEYEFFDADSLEKTDLPSIFQGTTLFSEKRAILIKDLTLKKELFSELPRFLHTEHKIAILEQKIDKRNTVYKELLSISKTSPNLIRIENYKLPDIADTFLTFRVFDIALKDGRRAVRILREAEAENSPYLTIGAWTKKALDLLVKHPNGEKEKRIIKELAQIDLLLKDTKFSKSPWTILESFLIRLSNI